MKKNYFLLFVAFMVTAMSYGQTPIITMIADGDCTGGVPKVVEIYADGAVDFTLYSLENETNANTTWGNTTDLSALGTITDSFVYLYYDNGSPQVFSTEFSSATNPLDLTSSSVLSVNGDDRVRIIKTADATVIDQYGVSDTDGTATVWEYTDGYAKRNSFTSANGGNFNPANWTNNKGSLNTFGSCQGGATFESIIGLASFTPGTSTVPTLAITSPVDGSILPPGGNVTVSFAVSNFNVAAVGAGDGHIKYIVDSNSAVMQYDINPISLTGLSVGSHTVTIELVDDNDASLSTAITAAVTFSVSGITQVANIAALRAGTIGSYYELTGEAFINTTVPYNNQKYIQDATAGILIYDADGNITSGVRGNGISGVTGQLTESNSMFRFIPTMDATTTTSPAFTPTAQVVTLAQLTTNGEDYEAELVKVEGVTFADTGAFANGINYTINQGADQLNFRTNFYDVDYITTTIPTVATDIIALVGQYNTTYQITARDLADFSNTAAVSENIITGLQIYPNPATGNVLNIRTATNGAKTITIYNVLGNKVFTTSTADTQISLPTIKAGIYLLNVTENGKTATTKLMIK